MGTSGVSQAVTVFFGQFCVYPTWQLCKGRFSQIWLQAKYESRVFEHPSIFLAIYLNHV
jgi:hypothetical protein